MTTADSMVYLSQRTQAWYNESVDSRHMRGESDVERDEESVRGIMSTITEAMTKVHNANAYKPETRKTLDIAWHQLDGAFDTVLRALHQVVDEKE